MPAAGVRKDLTPRERTQLIHSTDSHSKGACMHLCTWERKLPTEPNWKHSPTQDWVNLGQYSMRYYAVLKNHTIIITENNQNGSYSVD